MQDIIIDEEIKRILPALDETAYNLEVKLYANVLFTVGDSILPGNDLH